MIRLLLVIGSMVLLSACGGGGGGSSPAPLASAPPLEPAPEPESESPPTEPVTPPGFATGEFVAFENFEQQCASPRIGFDSNGAAFPDVQGSATDENNWLRSWSNELYLWYDEIADVDPASLETPDYFEQMRTFATTPSGAPKDQFHFTVPTDEWIQESESGIVGGYGATIRIIRATPPREVIVAYTEPNTPATAPSAALKRGTRILEIDGADMVNGNDVATLNAGLFPGDNETHTFVVQDVDSETPRSINMTSTQITTTPVQNVSTLETESGLVGYLTFNDHIAPAEQQLVEAITELRDANITDLVIDLRYNGGGFLDIANILSYMVAGDTAVGQVFEAIEFNDKHPDFNPVTGRQLTPSNFRTTAAGFSVASGTPLPSLGLDRVFVLSGSGTCSASESIINGLRGIDVEVILIGDTTCGKPYGFYAFDNCGTTYFSIQFRGVNQKGFGDYSDGFSPQNLPFVDGEPVAGCAVTDDFSKGLGDPEEARLNAALTYRTTGACPPTTAFGGSALARPRPSTGEAIVAPLSPWRTNRILLR